MSKKLTTRQKQLVKKNELKTRNLVTIYLDEPVRILENDTISLIEINGKQYITGSVKRGDIETGIEGVLEKVEIKISNINQGISSLAANQGDVLTNSRCTVETVIFDDATNEISGAPVQLFDGRINAVELNAIELKFTIERVIGGYSTVSPNATYDVNCQCRKFKDERCGYTGEETICDKTLTRCKELENSLNFYGFPSIPKDMVIR
jgi:phage-related protein